MTSSTRTYLTTPAETELPQLVTPEMINRKNEVESMLSSKLSFESGSLLGDGTSGATMDTRKMISSLTSEEYMLTRSVGSPLRNCNRNHTTVSGLYKGQVYKFDDQD